MPDATHPSGDRAPGPPPYGLPLQLTSFVGREREVAELEEILTAEARLLTLSGPGGSGKSRLALAVSSGLAERFEDGVWWVELAPISDPELVPQSVASALMVHETAGHTLTYAIAEDLRDLQILIVLDNCEHVVGACAELADTLLRSCPSMRILATSREALGVAGEKIWPVPPLSFPGVGALPSIEELERYESVRLFVERARYRVPGFELDSGNASSVAGICRRLDGMPLAIELAAARVGALSVAQILARLDRSLQLLASRERTSANRQLTLRATLDWGYELLEEDERELFARLSVFAGGFTLEAAEAVGEGGCIEGSEVLNLLARLVDKSLVVAAEKKGDESRYRLLETVKQYGSEKLGAGAEPVRERHAQYYLALAEEAEPELRGVRQVEWLERLEREHGNLQTALGWSREGGDAELGLRLAVALERFWWACGHLSEGRRWLDRGLAGSGGSPPFPRAQALNEAGWLALWQDDLERAVEFLQESLGLFKELGDEPGIATSLTNLGHTVLHQNDKVRLKALSEEAGALRERFVDRWAIAELLLLMGTAALYEGDHARAVGLLEESITSFRDLGDKQRAAVCLTYLWMAALEGGHHERAAALLKDEFRRLQEQEIKPQIQIYDGLMGLAVVAAREGRPARAARLGGAAETIREAISLSILLWDHTPTDYEGQLAAARSRLEETDQQEAWTEGRAMTPDQAIAYALSEEDLPQPRTPSTTSYPAGLSAREVEVLKLVARGLTNAQIARDLFISPRTVDSHLNSVYRKLGTNSRAAATRFATEHGIL